MKNIATINNWDSDAYDIGSYMQNYCANQILREQVFSDNVNILDLGCGNGRTTANILNYAPSATILGIDRSPKMVARAQEAYSNDHIFFEHRDISCLEFQEKFDLVVSFFCLDWIKDQLSLQQKVFAALKSKGEVLYVISTGNDDIANIVKDINNHDKWSSCLKNYHIPAGLHTEVAYKSFMQQAGFVINQFSVINIPVELPNIKYFYQFIAALPLFGEVLTKKQNDDIKRDITKSFQQYCKERYQGRIVCVGEMIVIRAHRP